MPEGTDEQPVFAGIRPSGDPMRVVSGRSVRDCWNRLAAEAGRSIAELKRAGWRVERTRDATPAPGYRHPP